MTIHWKVVEQYFTVVLLGFQIYPVRIFWNNLAILDLALSGVKGLRDKIPDSLLICNVQHTKVMRLTGYLSNGPRNI